jgi:hypothetical protein
MSNQLLRDKKHISNIIIINKNLLLLTLIILSQNINSQIPNYLPLKDLVCWYPFNGNSLDESGNAYHCYNNGVSLTNDRLNIPNSAYLFNGNGLINSQQNHINADDQVTMAVWFKFTEVTSGDLLGITLVHNGQLFKAFGLAASTSSNLLTGHAMNQTFILNKNVITPGWNHAILSWDGFMLRMYHNGQFIDSANFQSSGLGYSCGINIGGSLYYTNSKYKGVMDDVVFWKRALTLEEIKKLYSSCNDKITLNPVNQTVDVGGSAQFTVGYSNSSPIYKWQTSLGVGFQDLNNSGQYSGVNTFTLKVNDLTIANNNQLFRCIITNGNCIDTSAIVSLSVKNNSNIINYFQNEIELNISKNSINVELNDFVLKKCCYLKINNLLGQTILKENIINKKSEFNISNFKNDNFLILQIFDQKENLLKQHKIILF